MYKLLFTAYTEESELRSLITNDFKKIDHNFYLFNSKNVNVSDIKYSVWDVEYFAEMSFQTYDKEEEMEQFIINELTQQRLKEIYFADDPYSEFQAVIEKTFKLENA
ncbi:hypothetical protein ACFQZE_07125 [Paenibacillus sp. GCM10027627]|uniref:hypothetical protein n=1 Tax=unclassified Paenibacillus TaxID=185978 RepID=UPI00363A5000